jgi:ABC-type phosphate transport system substrate-binding protein
MRNLLPVGIVALLIVCAGVPLSAADFKVIANSSVKADTISTDDLKAIFLATKSTFSDGGHAEPVWGKGGAIHEEFLKQYVGKTDAALGTYYRSLVFTGKASMPKSFATDAEVAEYVAKNRGAIGYVSAGTNAEGVKTLEVK